MRGQECETNKGVEIEAQLEGQNKRLGGAEPGGFGKLAAVIRRRVRPLGTVPAHELDQRGGDRAALPVANVLDDRENTVRNEDAVRLGVKRRALEPMRCGRRDNRPRRSPSKGSCSATPSLNSRCGSSMVSATACARIEALGSMPTIAILAGSAAP
jgi:hypothetical protein